ncbi:MAG TPA: cytochrome c [Vicinamibacterales bacterium]|nr:cytochrome c [Vicinamibacterales bacterium]
MKGLMHITSLAITAGLLGVVPVAGRGAIGAGGVPRLAARVTAAAPGAEDTYLDKCAVCHGADGAGKTAKGRKLKVKDVRETIKTVDEAAMIKIVTDGKAPNMDAYGADFTPAEIKALVEYYRGLAK